MGMSWSFSPSNATNLDRFVCSELLDEYGVRLNVLGRTELLPERVQQAVKKAEEMTRHNDKCELRSVAVLRS